MSWLEIAAVALFGFLMGVWLFVLGYATGSNKDVIVVIVNSFRKRREGGEA